VISAFHGADVTGYFGTRTPVQGAEFETVFMTIWGNFITKNYPSISASIANGANSTSTESPASNWPAFSLAQPYMLDLNQTGGTPVESKSPLKSVDRNITVLTGPGLRNDIRLVAAYTWEGGRGTRCDFWRSVGRIVPE